MKYILNFRPVLLTSSILVLCLFLSYISYFDSSKLVVWSKQYEGEIAFGSHGNNFFVYNDKSISCMALDDGKIIWQRHITEAICNAELVTTSKIETFVLYNDLQFLYCLDARNGNLVWKTAEINNFRDDTSGLIPRDSFFKTFFTDKINDIIVTQNKEKDILIYNISDGKALGVIRTKYKEESLVNPIYSEHNKILFSLNTGFHMPYYNTISFTNSKWSFKVNNTTTIAYDLVNKRLTIVEGDVVLFKINKLFVADKDNLNRDFYKDNFLKVYDTSLSLLWEHKTHGRIFVDCEDDGVLVASTDGTSKIDEIDGKIKWSRGFDKYVDIDNCWLDKDRVVINYMKGSLEACKSIQLKDNEYLLEEVEINNLNKIDNDVKCFLGDPFKIILEIIDFNKGTVILQKTYNKKINCYFNRGYLLVDDNQQISSNDPKKLYLNIHNLHYLTRDETTFDIGELFTIDNDIFYGGINLLDDDSIFFNTKQEIKPFIGYWNKKDKNIYVQKNYYIGYYKSNYICTIEQTRKTVWEFEKNDIFGTIITDKYLVLSNRENILCINR